MKYILTAPQVHLTEKSETLLARRLNQLSRHLPSRLATQPLHITLKQNIARNYVEGMAELHVPGRVLVAKAQARTIREMLNKLTEKMKQQMVRYTTTHDRSHSQFPNKATIRKMDGLVSVE